MKYFFCIFFPPAAVLLANRKAALIPNIILTCLVWLPGVIHAFMVVNGAEADRRHKELIEATKQGQQPPQS